MKTPLHPLTLASATALVVVLATPAEAVSATAGYGAYTADTYAADALAQSVAHTSILASAQSAAAAADAADANGGEGGSGSHHCSATTFKPRGSFDPSTSVAHVEVTTDVWCNFTPRQLTVKVILQGYEGAHDIHHPSPDVTCSGSATCTATAHYYRQLYCGETFQFEHYGVPYGSYQLKNGTWRTIVGNGVPGPRTSGGAYRYCGSVS